MWGIVIKTKYCKTFKRGKQIWNPNHLIAPRSINFSADSRSYRTWLRLRWRQMKISCFSNVEANVGCYLPSNPFLSHLKHWTWVWFSNVEVDFGTLEPFLSVNGGGRFFFYSFIVQTSHSPSSINRGPPPFRKTHTKSSSSFLLHIFSLLFLYFFSKYLGYFFSLKSKLASSKILDFELRSFYYILRDLYIYRG